MTHRRTELLRRLDAPPEAVYRAITDPVAVAQWMVPDGMTSEVHAFEAREGGAFRISLTYDNPTNTGKTTAQRDTYHGRFVRLVPNREVVQVMEFESDDPSMLGEMRSTFRLSEVDGGTDLHAIHDDVPPGVSLEANEIGWCMALDKLARYVRGNPRS